MNPKSTNLLIGLESARIAPSAIDVEEVVLGQILIDSECLSEAMALLFTDVFYKDENKKTFEAIKNLYNKNNPVNIITVVQELQKTNNLEYCGGPYYISTLTNRVSSTAGIEYHIRIITEKYLKREQIRIGSETINSGYDDTVDVFTAQNDLENKVSKLNQHIIGKDFEGEIAEEIEVSYKFLTTPRKNKLTGVTTGSSKLNEITGGWQPGDFIIICARPSHGKTSRLIQYMVNAAIEGHKVAFFSIEMNKLKIHTKMINHISEVSSEAIKYQIWNREEQERIEAAKNRIKTLPMYINEKSAVTPNYIRAVCRERKRKYGLDLIAIDYLQLMMPNETFRGQSEENKIGNISLNLKYLAKDMNIPIIALSQLSRECESRQNKRPICSDLRHSGQIEQDADVILSQYIPSKYYKKEADPDYKDQITDSYERISETGVLKNRMGETNLGIMEYFYGERSRYYSSEPQPIHSNFYESKSDADRPF